MLRLLPWAPSSWEVDMWPCCSWKSGSLKTDGLLEPCRLTSVPERTFWGFPLGIRAVPEPVFSGSLRIPRFYVSLPVSFYRIPHCVGVRQSSYQAQAILTRWRDGGQLSSLVCPKGEDPSVSVSSEELSTQLCNRGSKYFCLYSFHPTLGIS